MSGEDDWGDLITKQEKGLTEKVNTTFILKYMVLKRIRKINHHAWGKKYLKFICIFFQIESLTIKKESGENSSASKDVSPSGSHSETSQPSESRDDAEEKGISYRS